MKTILSVLAMALVGQFSAAADELAKLKARQLAERNALEQKQAAESLGLIERQLEELEILSKRLEGRDAKAAREAIEFLLKSTDAGRRVKAELFVDKISAKKPGTIKAMVSTAEKLAISKKDAGGKWARMPEILLGASIYTGDWKRSNGVADFKVTKSGRIFLALNYDYQGNSSGNWTEDRLLAGQFMARGWAQVRGAELIAWNNRTYQLFTRVCHKGEHFRLRCNKYEPPYVIVLDEGAAVEK